MFHRLRIMLVFNVLLMNFYTAEVAKGGTITVTPSFRLAEEFDSNPFYSGDAGNTLSDFITVLTPQLEINREGQALNWSALYSLGSRYYSSYPELNYLSQRALVDINTVLSSRSSLTISDSLTSTEDSLATTNTGIQTGRTGILYNTASLALSRRIGATGSANMALTESVLDYKGPEYVSTKTDIATLSGSWGWSPSTTLTTSYNYSNYSFGTATDENIGNHFLSLGFVKTLSPSTSFSFSGGFVYTPDVDERWDWTSNASWEKTSQYSSFSLGYNRRVRNSSGYTAEIEVRERGYVAWSVSPGRSFSANVTGGYTQSTSIPSSRLETTSYYTGIGCVWRPYSWLSADANYSHFQQWASGTESAPLSRERVYIGFTAMHDGWRF